MRANIVYFNDIIMLAGVTQSNVWSDYALVLCRTVPLDAEQK